MQSVYNIFFNEISGSLTLCLNGALYFYLTDSITTTYYLTESKCLKWCPECINLAFCVNKSFYETCSKCCPLKLKQSYNRWMNDCLDHSILCGFIAAHSSIIRSRIFHGVAGTFLYTKPFQVATKRNLVV
jgi:hypothetical protein